MTRRDVRVGIAKYFGGAVLDARGFYRPTPLAANRLAGVKAYYADRFDDDRDYADGLAAGTFGAIMCVHVAESTETRLTIGGTINRPYVIELYLWYLATKPPMEDAQAAFDDLIEAVIARIRADPTLGGVVVQAGEMDRGISTTSAVPYAEPDVWTYGSGVVSFDARTYPNIA